MSAAGRRLRVRLNTAVDRRSPLPEAPAPEPSEGVYAAAYLTYASHASLARWSAEIINPALPAPAAAAKPDSYHATTVYSRKPCEYHGHGVVAPFEVDAVPYRLELFGAPGGPKHLVLAFSSRVLANWHATAMAAGASWDFPSYQPHITLGSDLPEGFDVSILPVYAGPLAFRYEAVEPLKDD